MLYGLSQNMDASVQLFDRHELARPVREAYIAWTEDDRFGSQFSHLRRLRPESDCSGLSCRGFFQESHERGISRRLHPAIQPYDIQPAIKIRILRSFIQNRRVD